MRKRGRIFLIAVILSCGVLKPFLSREDFAFRRIKQPLPVAVTVSKEFVLETLEKIFRELEEKGVEAWDLDDFISRVEELEHALATGRDIDPAKLEEYLLNAGSPWEKLAYLTVLLGSYGTQDVRSKAIQYLSDKIDFSKPSEVRRLANSGLKWLFPYLDSGQKLDILVKVEEKYTQEAEKRILRGDIRGANGLKIEYLGVVADLIPGMRGDEITSFMSRDFLTEIVIECVASLQDSDIDAISKVIKYFEPYKQQSILGGLLLNYERYFNKWVEEVEQYGGEVVPGEIKTYKEVISGAIKDLIINNLPYCQNSNFLEGALAWVEFLSQDPDTEHIARIINVALEPYRRP